MPNAIITGASKGMGKAIAEKLLVEGYSIAICARTEKDLEELKSEWFKKYPDAKIVTVQADMAIEEQVTFFAEQAITELGHIDILVNNVGMYTPMRLIDEPKGHMEKTMQVNVYSAYYLTKAIVPHMKRDSKSHIFNVCSVASLKAYPGTGSYGMSKYALLGFSENLREELRSEGIKVTALIPGGTLTHSWEGADVAPERLIAPEDIAEVLWTSCNLSIGANVEQIILRPAQGDL